MYYARAVGQVISSTEWMGVVYHAGSIEGFNRTELEIVVYVGKNFQSNRTGHPHRVTTQKDSPLKLLMLWRRTRECWFLVTHLTTIVTVYVSTEQILQVPATYVGRH